LKLALITFGLLLSTGTFLSTDVRAEEAPAAEAAPATATEAAAAPAETPPATDASATAATDPAATPAADAPAETPATASTGEEKPETETAAKDDKKEGDESEEGELDESQRAQRKSGIARLLKKMMKEDGTPTPMAILTPLDYTTLNFAGLARETIKSSILRYGKFDVRALESSPQSLTLEEFRRLVVKHNVDIVVLCVLKPTNFDLFLYDRRAPYNIYAHSEVLPETVQYQLTKEVVEEYTKVIVRRTLYAYMQEQFFELPREETRPFLNAEIPRWIASNASYTTVNREILSSYYLAGSVGAAFSSGSGKVWNSSMYGIQLGRKLFGGYYVEGSVDLFAYNSFLVGARKVVVTKDNPFSYTIGLGVATASNKHTLNFDQNFSQGEGGKYIVPSASIIIPIVDLHFKVEGRLYAGLGGGKMIFTVSPGLFLMF